MSIQPGIYKIVNVKGGTALDLSGGDNRTIMGFTVHGGDNQQWTISDPDESENQTIFCASSGLYLSIEGAPEDWTRIVGSSSSMKWAIRRDEEVPDAWRVYFPGTCHNFDLSDHGNSTPGIVIHLWEKTPGQNQLWRFERI